MSTEPGPKRGLRAYLAATWERMLSQHATPVRLGWAVGTGVFFGCSPLIGLQTVVALAVAYLFRLNRVAVLIGLQISFGPLTALAVFLDAQLGEWILHRALLPMTVSGLATLKWNELGPRLVADMAVGGLLFGGTLGSAAGLFTTWFVHRRRRMMPAFKGPP